MVLQSLITLEGVSCKQEPMRTSVSGMNHMELKDNWSCKTTRVIWITQEINVQACEAQDRRPDCEIYQSEDRSNITAPSASIILVQIWKRSIVSQERS